MPKFLNFEPCFAAKVDKDTTFINQNIVKITMNDLRAKQEMPRSVRPSLKRGTKLKANARKVSF